jgi:glutaminyl-tRNA synthetase
MVIGLNSTLLLCYIASRLVLRRINSSGDFFDMNAENSNSDKNGKNPEESATQPQGTDFIRAIIKEDIASGKHGGRVHTRFPPEPNGYLHIGHAKSICLNFGIAKEFPGAKCNLRFDDTNPSREDQEYIDSIYEDVKWLGFDWEDRCYFASDYFEKLYNFAEELIKKGHAYVCELSAEEIRQYRGTLTEPGRNSPYRDRSIDENLDLFRRMRAGEFPDGSKVLRAKIDMASPNINMRDPVVYRILRSTHHRTGDGWCIYPMYDYAHPVSDSIESITYSICTLEFEDHRPLYDWFLEKLEIFRSRQIEFARLNLNYTVMSKRKLLELVQKKIVSGWDDPRMPTISGLRRRGVTPSAIRDFCDRIGVAKRDSTVDMALLEHCIREDLNTGSPRVMAVLNPLKVTIENYPENKTENFDIAYHPDKPEMGSRKVPFCREIFIEQDDFMENPSPKFFRLSPGREVRLRGAYFINCKEIIKDASGVIKELICTYDPETKGGNAPDGRKVKGTLHWVSAVHGIPAEIRLYDRLYSVDNPGAEAEKAEKDSLDYINPESLLRLEGSFVEPSLAGSKPSDRYQFERLGYFCVDLKDSVPGRPVFNRTVTLKDTWAKIDKTVPEKTEQPKIKKPKPMESVSGIITIDDFSKVDLRSGKILEAGLVEGSDKMIRLSVDMGEMKPRQIFAGIKEAYPDPGVLIGKMVVVVANLKPRQMKFGLSEGMILAGSDLKICTFDGIPEPGGKVS